MSAEKRLGMSDLAEVIGYNVLDRNDSSVGTVSAIWADDAGQPAFVGIETGWLIGKTHVAPARDVSINRPAERIRLPFTEDEIKGAPSFDPDTDLSAAEEQQVTDYYSRFGRRETRREMAGEPSREAEKVTIPLHEEELKVGKRTVEAGGVRLRKVVRTETVQQPVELRHEDIVIERHPARRAGEARTGRAFEGEEVYIPWRREEPVIEKETRVREEIEARKRADLERQTIAGQVRKEDVRVEDERTKSKR